ncbi:alpha/beta-hydrolase family protein [Nocardioides pantholopis]|uniref:alpha/beta-hydrolase family protein n=1 Tax=Nocardioides pantholopis TaxID=2483798 RepID=UPI000FDB6B93|nr:alpha/beta-hydrolase family protein [Nocardioides pantholopis]
MSSSAAATPLPGPAARWVRAARAPTLLGAVLGVYLLVQSWSPSLLARDWVFEGVVGGVALVVGYAVGTLLTRAGHLARRRRGWGWAPFEERTDLRVRAALALVLVGLACWAAVRAVDAHRWTWERLGYEPESWWLLYGGTLAVTALVATVLFLAGWALRLVRARLARLGRRWLPAWVAGTLALVLVAWVVLASLNNYVLQRSLDGFNATFEAGDLDVGNGPAPPTSPLRSGGPRSAVRWDEVGDQGRRFLTRGPSADEIAELAPAASVEPVRVFVGRAAAEDLGTRVRLAMAELERYGAFERAAVLVVVPTGTGWVNEQIVQPVEYLYAGDAATVAVQYSHLPSPLAYLAEQEAAGDTGRALVRAVRERLDEIPAPRRPALLVAGESLGSTGGAAAFTSLPDLLASTDGAVWVGPPETMHLRREAERSRRPESPQVRPVVGDGRDVVFANRPSDLDGTAPRSVFLQQGDDPIVWWDWATALEEPNWIEEPLDSSVNPDLTWTPLTTFLNLAVDMAVSNDFDEDHGHRYGTQPLAAWRAILDPAGWDDARVEALRARLADVSR